MFARLKPEARHSQFHAPEKRSGFRNRDGRYLRAGCFFSHAFQTRLGTPLHLELQLRRIRYDFLGKPGRGRHESNWKKTPDHQITGSHRVLISGQLKIFKPDRVAHYRKPAITEALPTGL